MAEAKKTSNAGFAIAIWAAILVTVFVAFRSTDLLRLPSLLGNLGGGSLFGGEGILAVVVGAVVSGVVLVAWFGTGTFVFRYLKTESSDNRSRILEVVRNIAVGAAITSLLWFFLGLAGFYSTTAAIIVTLVAFVEGGLSLARVLGSRNENRVLEATAVFDKALLVLMALPLVLGFIGALAPPIAKDTLLYHFALPKAFIVQGNIAFIEGNVASYLALGTEMHAVWAMLLGNIVSPRAGEAAAGAIVFTFFPLLLGAIYGWGRELGISKRWSLVATLMVAAVPTAFHISSSGYVDLALALFITLAIRSLGQWWRTQDRQSIILIAIFVGAALSIKLTTVFVVAAFALIMLLRARGAKSPVAIAPGSDIDAAAVATASATHTDGEDTQAGSLRSDTGRHCFRWLCGFVAGGCVCFAVVFAKLGGDGFAGLPFLYEHLERCGRGVGCRAVEFVSVDELAIWRSGRQSGQLSYRPASRIGRCSAGESTAV